MTRRDSAVEALGAVCRVRWMAGLMSLTGCLLPLGCYVGVSAEDPALSSSSAGETEAGVGGDDDSEAGGDGSTGRGEDDVPLLCSDGFAEELAPGVLRRLTLHEYANTVTDLFGVDVSARLAAFPRDIRSSGFTNTATALVASYEHVTEWELAARDVAAKADEDVLRGYTSCVETTTDCYAGFVRELGLRVFRRPLDAEAVDAFVGLFQTAVDDGGTFEDGARLVVSALLQSPQFLYRIEQQGPDESSGGTHLVDDYELASRLSFFIWEAGPDDVLLERARLGELGDPDTLDAEVERMLASTKARRSAERFARDWLGLDGLAGVSRDAARYPELDGALKDAMARETLDLYARIVWDDDAPLVELLTSYSTLAEPSVAALYGLDPAEGVAEYDLGQVPHRRGLLTQPAILALSAHGDTPSIVARALFIYENILCREVATPPADVNDVPPPNEPGKTQRAYSEERISEGTCGGCHITFDPYGYAFEVFDGIGRFSEEDYLGNPLRSDGVYPGPDQASFDGVDAFIDLLSADPGVGSCLSKKHLQFSMGRPLGEADECVAQEIAEAFEARGGTYRAMIGAIASHPGFGVRVAE